jgi:hypothetical protein
MVLLGVVGLLVGWQIEGKGDNAAVLAVVSALALAAGSLLAASAGGEVAVRVTGGLLFVPWSLRSMRCGGGCRTTGRPRCRWPRWSYR